MSLRRSEAELESSVLKFLRREGCDLLKTEVPLADRGVDIFGLASGLYSRSYAVELKVQDWQKALRQAAIYQLCADYCYVAMPCGTAERLDRESFQAAGVGLLSVNVDSELVAVLCEARRSSVKRLFYAGSLEESVRG